jgi:hypothetical protein
MPLYTGAKAGNLKTAAAFEQGSTWSTPVAVGASDGAYLLNESLQGGPVPLDRETLGIVWGDAPDRGAQAHRGALSGWAFYGANFGKLLSFIFGTSGAPTQTPPSTGTTYLHNCDLATSLSKFFTLCIARKAVSGDSLKWHEYDSCMMGRVVFSGSGNDRVRWSADVLANRLDRDSSTNTTTQTDAVTMPTTRGITRFTQGLFRINAQAGATLASTTDDLAIAGFELEIMRPLSEDFLADGTGELAQPAEQDVCVAMLRVDLRSYDSDTWKTAYAAGTEYKADLKFLSGVTPSGGSEMYVQFQMPRLVVAEEPQANIGGRGRITHRVTFKLLTASTAPTGMSGVTAPVRMNVLDENSSAYLA